MSLSSRAPGIDALRLLGAVLVVGLHVGSFPEWPTALMQLSRGSGRWVVPFFFVVMGLFIGRSAHPVESALTSARRLLRILLAVTVLYLVLLGTQMPARQVVATVLSPETMERGVWVHLWFLHSAIAGLLLSAAAPGWVRARKAWWTVLAVLLVASAIDSLFAMHRMGWGPMLTNRFVAGIAMVLLGIKLGQLRLDVATCRRLGAWLLLAGIGLCLIQGLAVWRLGGQAADLQLQLGAIVLGVAGTLLALAVPSSATTERLADWGRRFALGLYLLHPLFIEAMKALGVARSDVLWLVATLVSLAVLWLLERWVPRAKALLDGRRASDEGARARVKVQHV